VWFEIKFPHYYTFLKKPIVNTLKAFYPLGFLSKNCLLEFFGKIPKG
jgi:hypothetical protein